MIKEIYEDLHFMRGLDMDEVMELAYVVIRAYDFDDKNYRELTKLYDRALGEDEELDELDYQRMLKLIIIMGLRGEK